MKRALGPFVAGVLADALWRWALGPSASTLGVAVTAIGWGCLLWGVWRIAWPRELLEGAERDLDRIGLLEHSGFVDRLASQPQRRIHLVESREGD